jgi:hypothetical protein
MLGRMRKGKYNSRVAASRNCDDRDVVVVVQQRVPTTRSRDDYERELAKSGKESG